MVISSILKGGKYTLQVLSYEYGLEEPTDLYKRIS